MFSYVNFQCVFAVSGLLLLASCGGGDVSDTAVTGTTGVDATVVDAAGADATAQQVVGTTGADTTAQQAESQSQLFISGGGVKGPLAFANVQLYALDTRFDGLYNKGRPIAFATTNAFAEITDLPVPDDVAPPYILVVDGTNAVDLNTNEVPVISKLITIITQASLATGQPAYATPYTTLAYQMLKFDSYGDGLHATYFNGINLSQVVLERIDSSINFDWKSGSPQSAVNVDEFSVRWTGFVEPEYSENYTFYTSTDDGVRLWVDGELLIDQWVVKVETEYSATIPLVAGERYDIVMEYYDSQKLAAAKLLWSSDSVAKTIIPKANLYSTDDIDVPALAIAARMVKHDQKIIQAIGFGVSADTSLFTTSPIITTGTTTVESQQRVVQYRAAIEAFSALLHTLSLASQPHVTTDILLERLALDLHSDGLIDAAENGRSIDGIDIAILGKNPMDITIPNTQYQVKDTVQLIDKERVLVGDGSNVTFYKDDVLVDLQAATLGTTIIAENPINTGYSGPGGDLAGLFEPPPAIAIETPVDVSYSEPVGNLLNTLLASGLTASGPIVINGEQDVVISGLRITNPSGHCIAVKNGASNIIIENSEIGPCGKKGIDITNASHHITIRNNYIHDIENEAIMSYKSNDIAVDSNVIVNAESGYEMWTTKLGNLSFTNNHVKNIVRKGNGNGGNIAMVAFVRGGGIRINNNIGINIVGKSNTEDLINIFKSQGLPDDPIQIRNNRFKGGGPSSSGGGIMAGDQGGAYQLVENNILINPGQYGLAIAGGHHIVVRNNQVFSDDQRDFTNVGIYVWRFDKGGKGTKPGDCYSHTVGNNIVTWWKGPNNRNNGLPASLNSSWLPNKGADGLAPNCGDVAGWSSNRWDTKNAQPANLDMSLWNSDWDNP